MENTTDVHKGALSPVSTPFLHVCLIRRKLTLTLTPVCRQEVGELDKKAMLRGPLGASQQLELLSACEDLHSALEGAFYVQECVFEDLGVKQSLFQDVEALVGSDVILSSSTSCLVPSAVFSRVQTPSRCLVAHPVNPPYLVKLVELVPHPQTSAAVMDAAQALMNQVGQVPVRLSRELDGFALNRIQMAVIAESWRLVQEGVISVKDVDLVMSEGLGMRYAFIGPMETMHLNAPQGLGDYMQRYGPGIQRVLSSFGPTPDFSGDQAQDIVKEMNRLIPQEQLSAHIERRDQLLSLLSQIKKDH
uniref:Crystallin, lambda 1 n=1 Tax=Knipowitschia caucasica TaxID=637954 RepID=A0AAV2JZM9_KNICA